MGSPIASVQGWQLRVPDALRSIRVTLLFVVVTGLVVVFCWSLLVFYWSISVLARGRTVPKSSCICTQCTGVSELGRLCPYSREVELQTERSKSRLGWVARYAASRGVGCGRDLKSPARDLDQIRFTVPPLPPLPLPSLSAGAASSWALPAGRFLPTILISLLYMLATVVVTTLGVAHRPHASNVLDAHRPQASNALPSEAESDPFCLDGHRLPSLFLLGWAKCGTTSSADQLQSEFSVQMYSAFSDSNFQDPGKEPRNTLSSNPWTSLTRPCSRRSTPCLPRLLLTAPRFDPFVRPDFFDFTDRTDDSDSDYGGRDLPSPGRPLPLDCVPSQ